MGCMLLFTNLALAEMAVLYPVNGAFYTYIVRFVDPAWGFACGWEYALSWLTVLPFELIAASKTIAFWRTDIHMVCTSRLGIYLASTWHLRHLLGICAIYLASAPSAPSVPSLNPRSNRSTGRVGYCFPCRPHHRPNLWRPRIR